MASDEIVDDLIVMGGGSSGRPAAGDGSSSLEISRPDLDISAAAAAGSSMVGTSKRFSSWRDRLINSARESWSSHQQQRQEREKQRLAALNEENIKKQQAEAKRLTIEMDIRKMYRNGTSRETLEGLFDATDVAAALLREREQEVYLELLTDTANSNLAQEQLWRKAHEQVTKQDSSQKQYVQDLWNVLLGGDHVKRSKDEFNAMDVDGDGFVTRDELKRHVQRHGELWTLLAENLQLDDATSHEIATNVVFELATGGGTIHRQTTAKRRGNNNVNRVLTVDEYHAFRDDYLLNPAGRCEFLYRSVFAAFDVDGNGVLDENELELFVQLFSQAAGTIYKDLQLQQADLRARVQTALDKSESSSGELTYDEMRSVIEQTMQNDDEKYKKAQLGRKVRGGKRYLQRQQQHCAYLYNVMLGGDDSVITKWKVERNQKRAAWQFWSMDQDGDGVVTKAELAKYVEKHGELWALLGTNLRLPEKKCQEIATNVVFELATGQRCVSSSSDEEEDGNKRVLTEEQYAHFRNQYILNPEGKKEFFYRSIFAAFDVDNNGVLDEAELEMFLIMFQEAHASIYANQETNFFQQLASQVEGGGAQKKKNAQGDSSPVDLPQLRKLIYQQLDANGDGELSYEEIRSLIQQAATECTTKNNELSERVTKCVRGGKQYLKRQTEHIAELSRMLDASLNEELEQTQQEKAASQSQFNSMDLDGDGTVSKTELKQYVRQHGELWAMLGVNLKLDEAKCHEIATNVMLDLATQGRQTTRVMTPDDYHHFRVNYILDPKGSQEFFHRSVFAAFDVDQSGYLDDSELDRFLDIFFEAGSIFQNDARLPCSKSKLRQRVHEQLDENGDGKLSFEEIRGLINGTMDVRAITAPAMKSSDLEPFMGSSSSSGSPRSPRKRPQTPSRNDTPSTLAEDDLPGGGDPLAEDSPPVTPPAVHEDEEDPFVVKKEEALTELEGLMDDGDEGPEEEDKATGEEESGEQSKPHKAELPAADESGATTTPSEANEEEVPLTPEEEATREGAAQEQQQEDQQNGATATPTPKEEPKSEEEQQAPEENGTTTTPEESANVADS